MPKQKNNITRFLLIAFSIALSISLSSFFIPTENILIRIYSHLKTTSLSIHVMKGEYNVIADGKLISVNAGEFNYKLIYNNEDSVNLYAAEKRLGTYKYIKFHSDTESELKIHLINPERKPRIYQQTFIVSSQDGQLKLMNEIEVDQYIAGVTEAESGNRSSQEYYKVQSILARTFALAHINKHVLEGYSLCDQTHCQVYYGKPRDSKITYIVGLTKKQVVVDDNLNLIVAAFHSNSGGQTANSEDVWGAKTSYLKSVTDSFSLKMPNAHWQRKMLAEDWLTYLKLKHNYPTENDIARALALNFTQDHRKIYLEASNVKVPLKFVRQDLQLKSTFFSIRPISNDSILFTGRGYGHGIGMCQEGAMRMGKQGYSYDQILHFYYKNIQIINMDKLRFFKDE